MEDTRRLATALRPDMFGVWIFTPIPGTELWEQEGFALGKDEYHKLSFTYSEITEKVNRSGVRGLKEMRERFFSDLAVLTLGRMLRRVPWSLKLILSRPRRWKRICCYLRFSYRMAMHVFRYPAKRLLGKYRAVAVQGPSASL
jgi:hypothetical protein